MSAWTDAIAALPAPYLWWKVDETSGTTAADSSGNANDGTYASATLNQTGLIPGDSGGKSVSMPTTSANVSKISGMSYPNIGVTYATTFKTSTDVSTGRMFQAASSSTNLSFGSTDCIARISAGQAASLAYDPSALADNVAHLIVYVVRATTAELWVDGTMVASASHSGASLTMTAFAAKQSFGGPVGTYDDTLIWSTALSSTQIGDLYAGWSGGASGTTVTGSQVTETDTAQAGSTTVGANVQGGTASEGDAAQAGATTAGAVVSGGTAGESDTAQAGAVSNGQVVAGAQAAETDAAQAGSVTSGAVVAGNQGLEADAANVGSVVTAGIVVGNQAAETDVAQNGSVVTPPGGDGIDLSTFVDLYGTTTYVGGALTGASKVFTFPLAFDPATEYTIELDLADSAGTGGTLYSLIGPSEAEADLSNWFTLDSADSITSGTLTFVVGPGLGAWDSAVASGEHYIAFEIGSADITAIRITPPIGDVEEPPQEVGTDTTTRTAGRSRGGTAVATWEAPVVQPPGDEAKSHRHVGAVAFSAVTMDGAQPVYSVSEATKKRLRHRIMVGGKDVSFYRDVATPEPEYQLAEPLLWGPCSIDFPQIVAAFETPGELTAISDLRWCAKGKPVVIQRVDAEGGIVATDYRGVVVAYDVTDSGRLRLEVGGHATGRAQLRHKPVPIFRDTLDLGRLAWAAVRDLGLRFEPRLGPTTGIKQALWGGMDHLSYITELCAKAWQRDGTQWTVMPSEAGVYRMQRKDREVVDFTVFTDDKRAVPSLRSDAAEEPNRIFASGVTPKGQRVRFGVYPALKPSKPAPYPFTDGRNFDVGTTDADTDTGDGITIMVRTLWGMGYLSLEDASGEYDADVAKALAALQDDARTTGPVGVMTEALWAALFDFDVTGFNIRGSRIEPAAQAPSTQRYRRSASARIMGKNPAFDRHALIVDRAIDFGAGFTRHQMREWSRAEIARGEDNWVGTIKVTTGGVLLGQVEPGATIDGDDIMDVRAIKPGMNAWLPVFAGGILVHVSGVEIGYSDGIPNATLYVDTQARDAMTVWEIIRRNRESRRDPARRWKGNRASGEIKDSITEWDEVGGVLYDDVDLVPGWNVVPVVAGQEGTIARLRLKVVTEAGDGVEFACSVTGKKISAAKYNALVSKPLADSVIPDPATDEDDEDEPKPPPLIGDRAWERKSVRKALRAHWHLYSAGTHQEPCGYSPGRKTWETTTSQTANPAYDPDADTNSTGTDDDEFVATSTTTAHGKLTGKHDDDAGFGYRTARQPVLYLAVYVRRAAVLKGGRVMWNQLETGA